MLLVAAASVAFAGQQPTAKAARPDPAVLKQDRAMIAAGRAQLKADRAARNRAAVQQDRAKLRQDIQKLLADPGIVRNRLKVNATVQNAKAFLAVQKEFGSFDKYLYSFMPDGKPVINHPKRGMIPPRTELSDAISKDMKKRGFKFFGTTICYAHMQATGMVNDHMDDCDFR